MTRAMIQSSDIPPIVPPMIAEVGTPLVGESSELVYEDEGDDSECGGESPPDGDPPDRDPPDWDSPDGDTSEGGIAESGEYPGRFSLNDDEDANGADDPVVVVVVVAVTEEEAGLSDPTNGTAPAVLGGERLKLRPIKYQLEVEPGCLLKENPMLTGT
ncbi:hypothetical protein FRC17_006024 [Serendipita sp. 399]|nr:hypothetical protein FRC17_006024 [Serendipita sp. 399]